MREQKEEAHLVRSGPSKVSLGDTILVHSPSGARAMGSMALAENHGLLLTIGAESGQLAGPDGAVLTGAFPVACGGGPYQLLGVSCIDNSINFAIRIVINFAVIASSFAAPYLSNYTVKIVNDCAPRITSWEAQSLRFPQEAEVEYERLMCRPELWRSMFQMGFLIFLDRTPAEEEPLPLVRLYYRQL
jgi:hypothetical protein